ncbi:hypothetical protein GT030_30135 [Streptomyces sp. SID1328]|nr:hypothetical protein [Streptomyces sp. SID1328]MYV43010.1 hypothetical protein [Streptomyces sp. SID1328]
MAAPSAQARTVLDRSPAGGPRSSFPVEEYAVGERAQGTQAQVVMGLHNDQFLGLTVHSPE